jgi:flagellar biosynthesis protein FliQ
MTPLEIMLAAREMLIDTLLFVSPFLAASLATGIFVSLVQAGTRLNDMTLHFVPRLVAVALAIFLLAGWIGTRMIDYVERNVAATVTTLE